MPSAEYAAPKAQDEQINAKDVPAADEKAAETSANFGQAEPVVNPFAGVPHEELRSKEADQREETPDSAAAQPTDLPPPAIEYADPHEDDAQPAAEAPPVQAAAPVPPVHKDTDDEPANPRVEEVLAEMSQVMAKVEAVLAEEKKHDDTGVDPVIPGTEPDKGSGELEKPPKAQGAQREEDAEADRVRGELFPNAHLD